MLTERTELTAREGQAEAFGEAMRATGIALLAGVPGVESVRFGRGVENPDTFLLLIVWSEMAAHTAFGPSEASKAFRALVSPFLAGAKMEHFDLA